MDNNTFNEKVKMLKKLHLLGALTGLLAVAGLFCAPVSTLLAENGTPYLAKAALMVFCLGNIPLLYSLYNKNVVEADIDAEERMEAFVKWTYARMAAWLSNVLLCMLAYHFDTDALANRITSTLLMGILCLAVYAFLGKVRVSDIEE